MSKIDWSKLRFQYIPTNSYIKYHYKDGQWNDGELINSPNLTMSIAASCLHYGTATFEGLKAFRCKDGIIRVFRDVENLKRINASSTYICGPEIPAELFQTAIDRVINDNLEFVPPYGVNGSLYIRPLLLGTEPVTGLTAPKEYIFLILVLPVGSYYKDGIVPVDAIILDDYDRAAPRGSGCYKMVGNYAAGMYAIKVAKSKGFDVVLYMDSKTHTYFEEFTTSNFFAITKDGKYITPDSFSILPSITNDSIMTLAKDMGIPVEKRPVKFEEISTFAEVGACGTAVVITPIRKIVRNDKSYEFGNECGPAIKKLYKTITGIQHGDLPDKFGWLRTITKKSK